METITALVACAVAFALSYYIGYVIANNTLSAVLAGAGIGLAFAVVYFIATVAVGMLLPGTFDPRQLGIHLLILLPVTPIGSAVIAAVAHRYLERLESRRLPF